MRLFAPPLVRCLLCMIALIALPLAAAHAADGERAPASGSTTPALLASADLLADVAILERAYHALHPGLLRYNTQAQIDAHFATLREAFAQDRSLEEAYLAFSQFAATLQCGHTYANFFNQPRAIQQRLFEQPNRLPFHFRWLDGHMIVTANHSTDVTVLPGTEILAISGESAKAILARLLTVARADGGNEAKRVAWLEVQGFDRYEAFDIFYPLFFPQAGDSYALQVHSPGDVVPRSVTVPAIGDTARRTHARVAEQGASDTPAWTIAWPQPDLAVLRMDTWALYDSTWDWAAWLTETFDTLASRNTPNLVIDLRGNEGGLSVGDAILARLVDADLRSASLHRLVRYRTVPADLVPNLDTWDRSFFDWGADAHERDDRFFRLSRYDDTPDGNVIRPVAPRYGGCVFALVGAMNSSATFEFARQLQQAKLGVLVGQTTGGNRRGINGGAFFFLRLPNSRIVLDVPLIGQFPATPQPDAGIEPDMPVTVTAADIASGRDAEMEHVRALLRSGNPAAGHRAKTFSTDRPHQPHQPPGR